MHDVLSEFERGFRYKTSFDISCHNKLEKKFVFFLELFNYKLIGFQNARSKSPKLRDCDLFLLSFLCFALKLWFPLIPGYKSMF